MTTTISGTTGIDKVAAGAVTTNKLPAGTVLQVVQSTTSTAVTISANTYTDTTLTATITPTSATSKVLILVSQTCNYPSNGSATNGLGVRIVRNGSSIFEPAANDPTGPYLFYLNPNGSAGYTVLPLNYLDSPATTSAVTYKTQGRPYNLAATQFQPGGNPNNATSTIILMEIAA